VAGRRYDDEDFTVPGGDLGLIGGGYAAEEVWPMIVLPRFPQTVPPILAKKYNRGY